MEPTTGHQKRNFMDGTQYRGEHSASGDHGKSWIHSSGQNDIAKESMEKVTAMENNIYEDRNENEIEIDVLELLFVFKKKAWVIILAA